MISELVALVYGGGNLVGHPPWKGGSMAERPQGCAWVTGTVAGQETGRSQSAETPTEKEERIVTARVGQKAPDFGRNRGGKEGLRRVPEGIASAHSAGRS